MTGSRLRFPAWPLFGVAPRPGTVATPLPIVWPAKGQTDVLDYGLVLTCWLADAGDVIDSVTATISPGDATLSGTASPDGVSVVTWIAGGTAGLIYTLTFSIGTAGNPTPRALAIQGTLAVLAVEGATPPTAPVYLTDGAGRFLLGPGGVYLRKG